jgi:hypothetical protein
MSAAGKIDVNAGPNVNLTFGGSMNFNKGNRYSYRNSLMNFDNFGLRTAYDWRVYGKFTQRFQNNEEGSTSKIKSAYYSLMVDYSQSHAKLEDSRHKDKLFNYGYVGKFKTFREITYESSTGGDSLIHNGFNDTLVVFTPSEVNQPFAAQTSQYYNIYDGQVEGNYENLNQISAGFGLRNGDQPQQVYGIWDNLGTPYNYFGYTQEDQLRITGSGTINLNNHAVSIGFEYEQRWDRSFNTGRLGPIGLWTIARQTQSYLNYPRSHKPAEADHHSLNQIQLKFDLNFHSFLRLDRHKCYNIEKSAPQKAD